MVQQRLVDHILTGHPYERDLRRLRADREQARDREACSVRLQEAEQAEERRAIPLWLDHCRNLASAYDVTEFGADELDRLREQLAVRG